MHECTIIINQNSLWYFRLINPNYISLFFKQGWVSQYIYTFSFKFTQNKLKSYLIILIFSLPIMFNLFRWSFSIDGKLFYVCNQINSDICGKFFYNICHMISAIKYYKLSFDFILVNNLIKLFGKIHINTLK